MAGAHYAKECDRNQGNKVICTDHYRPAGHQRGGKQLAFNFKVTLLLVSSGPGMALNVRTHGLSMGSVIDISVEGMREGCINEIDGVKAKEN